MKFVPAGTKGVLFCTWLTRVQDFEAFVAATGHDATKRLISLGTDGGTKEAGKGWIERGHTWKNPGFKQGPDHPVSGINWADSLAFCKWLTEKERRAGSLAENQEYRLPTDAEWSQAVGTAEYPWGNEWPPPPGVGNYAGEEARDKDWPDASTVIKGYNDGYPRTSPVGSFPANAYGLYDMGGNVWEWCTDWYHVGMNTLESRRVVPSYDDDGGGRTYRVLRGGSWFNDIPALMTCSSRDPGYPDVRYGNVGCRVVLATG